MNRMPYCNRDIIFVDEEGNVDHMGGEGTYQFNWTPGGYRPTGEKKDWPAWIENIIDGDRYLIY